MKEDEVTDNIKKESDNYKSVQLLDKPKDPLE